MNDSMRYAQYHLTVAGERNNALDESSQALIVAIREGNWPLITPNMREHVQALWQFLDIDGDGTLTAHDFMNSRLHVRKPL